MKTGSGRTHQRIDYRAPAALGGLARHKTGIWARSSLAAPFRHSIVMRRFVTGGDVVYNGNRNRKQTL